MAAPGSEGSKTSSFGVLVTRDVDLGCIWGACASPTPKGAHAPSHHHCHDNYSTNNSNTLTGPRPHFPVLLSSSQCADVGVGGGHTGVEHR